MIILDRIYWFVSWAVITLIVAIIVAMILRLIANQADLNPFGWSSRTIRSLTDPLIDPVRRGLIRLRVDPKYAPLVTILLTILLGWFAVQLVAGLANTLAGILVAVERHAPVALIGYVLYGLISLFSLLVFIRIIFSWGTVSYSNRIMRFLVHITEPLLGPLRRLIPTVGMFDISPIVAFIILMLLQSAIAGTLLKGWTIYYFT